LKRSTRDPFVIIMRFMRAALIRRGLKKKLHACLKSRIPVYPSRYQLMRSVFFKIKAHPANYPRPLPAPRRRLTLDPSPARAQPLRRIAPRRLVPSGLSSAKCAAPPARLSRDAARARGGPSAFSETGSSFLCWYRGTPD